MNIVKYFRIQLASPKMDGDTVDTQHRMRADFPPGRANGQLQ